MKTVMILRLMRKAPTPMEKRIALSTRYQAMGTTMSVLLAGQGHGAQDGYEDKNRRHLEGEEQIAEEHFAEVGGGDHVVAQPRLCQVGAGGEKYEGQDADQDGDSRNADDVGCTAAVGKLFFAGIEQHDDEG